MPSSPKHASTPRGGSCSGSRARRRSASTPVNSCSCRERSSNRTSWLPGWNRSMPCRSPSLPDGSSAPGCEPRWWDHFAARRASRRRSRCDARLSDFRVVSVERTLVLVKPDGVQRRLIGEVITRFEKRGLHLVGLKLLQMDAELAERHYGEHQGKPFFAG